MTEYVNHPKHYTRDEIVCKHCGKPIECIDVVKHFNFSLGSALKYLWRAGLKGDLIEDLKKAVWYINFEIEERERGKTHEKQDEGMATEQSRSKLWPFA